MKKEMVIFFSKLSLGGMERALVEWIKNENLRKEYNITLYLGYVKERVLYDEIKDICDIHVFCKGKWNIFGKIISFIKMKTLKLKKYDVSICYSHHHKILSELTLKASNNNVLFIHTDLIKSRTKEELKRMKNDLRIMDYKKIVCVSENTKKGFFEVYPEYNGIVETIYNYINGEYILEKSKEKVEDFDFTKGIWFVNMSRHVESTKHISYVIEAARKLKDDNLDFNLLLIGDGESHNDYIELVKKYNLDNVHLVGGKSNPYKYLNHCNALILCSPFEGYGIVLDEARVLGKTLIAPDVGDAKLMCKDGYGILCDNSVDGFYKGMKEFINKGYNSKKFDYKDFNKVIEDKTLDLLRR